MKRRSCKLDAISVALVVATTRLDVNTEGFQASSVPHLCQPSQILACCRKQLRQVLSCHNLIAEDVVGGLASGMECHDEVWSQRGKLAQARIGRDKAVAMRLGVSFRAK